MVRPLKTHTPTYNSTPTRSTLDQHFYLYLVYQLYYGYLIRLYTLSKICLFNVVLCNLKTSIEFVSFLSKHYLKGFYIGPEDQETYLLIIYMSANNFSRSLI